MMGKKQHNEMPLHATSQLINPSSYSEYININNSYYTTYSLFIHF